MICYVGQYEPYEKGSESIQKLLRVPVSESSILRVTDKVGSQCSDLVGIHIEETLRSSDKTDEQEVPYVMMDGSMIQTRAGGWKESKLARIFLQGRVKYGDQGEEICKRIEKSEYVGHLGSKDEFLEKLERCLGDLDIKSRDRLVFVSDGAKWIDEWVKERYPLNTSILDYFHAMEHISRYVEQIEANKLYRKQRINKISFLLRREGLSSAKEELDKLKARTKNQKEEKRKLYQYFENNEHRMDYPEYVKKGYKIGSGAIESAHRTVIQKRLKLSGQHWTIKGAQNMINIRTISMSGNWDDLKPLFKIAV